MTNELHDRYASGVWGTRLRHAALAVLMAAGGEPMTVRQVWAEIHRRHIVQRGLRRKDDARQLSALGGRILDNLWQMLAPGGKLLFVTCSLWPQESEQQAAAFAAHNQASRLAAPGQLLPVADANEDHDGLFYALFQKPVL